MTADEAREQLRAWRDNLRGPMAKGGYIAHGSVAQLADVVEAAIVALDAADRWRDAVIDAAVVSWTYEKAHDDDPRAAINALLVQAQREALDPAISERAAEWVAARRRAVELLGDVLAQGTAYGEALKLRFSPLALSAYEQAWEYFGLVGDVPAAEFWAAVRAKAELA